jgi:hypothetical protein
LDVIVEDHLVARLELVQARAEMLGAGALGDPGGADAVGCRFEGIVQVAHPGQRTPRRDTQRA